MPNSVQPRITASQPSRRAFAMISRHSAFDRWVTMPRTNSSKMMRCNAARSSLCGTSASMRKRAARRSLKKASSMT